jgi:hypothetical protein
MDREHVLSPAAEEIVRRELSLMGADPGDIDQIMRAAQARMAASPDVAATRAAALEAADGLGRVLLQPRPFRIGARPNVHLWRRDVAGPELRVGLLG